MIRLVCAIAMCLCPVSVLAGDLFVGNGGEGVEASGHRLLLRDLWENGVDDPDTRPAMGAHNRVARQVFQLADIPFAMLESKIVQIERLRPGFARALVDSINRLRWHYGDKFRRFRREPLGAGAPSTVQIASREGEVVLIRPRFWQRLSASHKVALILHEAIGSLMTPSCEWSICHPDLRRQRRLVAALFDRQFLSRGVLPDDLMPRLNALFGTESAPLELTVRSDAGELLSLKTRPGFGPMPPVVDLCARFNQNYSHLRLEVRRTMLLPIGYFAEGGQNMTFCLLPRAFVWTEPVEPANCPAYLTQKIGQALAAPAVSAPDDAPFCLNGDVGGL